MYWQPFLFIVLSLDLIQIVAFIHPVFRARGGGWYSDLDWTGVCRSFRSRFSKNKYPYLGIFWKIGTQFSDFLLIFYQKLRACARNFEILAPERPIFRHLQKVYPCLGVFQLKNPTHV